MSNKLVGYGIVFPIKINGKGSVDIVSDKELIEASIKNILFWPKNHRFFKKIYGSRIFELLEEPNDNISKALIRIFIFDALKEFEPRISISNISTLKSNKNSMNIEIIYTIKNTNEKNIMVFPFNNNI